MNELFGDKRNQKDLIITELINMKNNTTKLRIILIELTTALFILTFFYAALSKLKDFNNFEIQLAKSPILGSIYGIVAIAIPVVEIVIVSFLLIERLRFIGLLASFTIMVAFTAYIFVILHFSEYIPCSCGGILQNMSWTQHLYFNFLLIILAAFAVMAYPSRSQELIAR